MAGETANKNALPEIRLSPLHGLDPSALLACAAETSAWSPPEPASLEEVLPGYRFIRLIGRGGMGAVYEAVQVELSRSVAIKIRPLQAGLGADAIDRFRREAKALARLDHPLILAIYHSGVTNDGDFYIATGYVDGEDLGQRMRREQIPVNESVHLLKLTCEALEFAHAQGVIHRDIKPSNILLSRNGDLKLADFGLAVFRDDSAGDRLTRVTSRLGTLEYSAPEQLAGSREASPALDVYSLGVIAYELLTGQLPRGAFDKPSAIGRVDSAFDFPIMRALSGDPASRWQSASEFKTALLEAHETALLAGTVEVLGGSQANLIENFYARSTEDIPPALTMLIQDQLLTSSGYRDSRALEDFLLSPGILQPDVQKLIARRILRIEKRGGRDFIELAHDRLTGAVHASREERRRGDQTAAEAARELAARRALRKRGVLATVFATAACLTLLSAGYAWLKKEEAQHQQQRAQLSRNEAEKLIGFLVDDLQNRLDEIGRLDLMKTSLTRVEDYYNSITGSDQTDLSLDHQASFYFTRGNFHRLSGNLPEAFKDLQHAVELTRTLHKRDPSTENSLKFVRSLNTLGRYYSLRQDFTNALALHTRAKEFLQPLVQESPSPDILHNYSKTLRLTGEDLGNLGRLEESKRDLTASVEQFEYLLANHPSTNSWNDDLGLTLAELGTWAERKGDFDLSLQYFTRYYNSSKALNPTDHWNNIRQGRIVASAGRVAAILIRLNRYDEALEKLNEAAIILEKQRELMPRSTYIWQESRFILGNISEIYRVKGESAKSQLFHSQFAEAEKRLKELGLR